MKIPKRFLWLLPIILLLIALTIPLLPTYNIKEVQVRTEFENQAGEIALASGLRTGSNIFIELLSKGNIFEMRLTDAENKISESYEYFKNIKVTAVLPSTVEITYDTKDAVFEVVDGDKFIVTDINGCVLGSRDSHKLGFIRITGVDIEKYSLGEPVCLESALIGIATDIYTELEWYDKSNLTAFREYIKWIDLSNPGTIALFYDDRILIKLDPQKDTSYQVAAMCVILSTQIQRDEMGTLDFTMGENPVFSED